LLSGLIRNGRSTQKEVKSCLGLTSVQVIAMIEVSGGSEMYVHVNTLKPSEFSKCSCLVCICNKSP